SRGALGLGLLSALAVRRWVVLKQVILMVQLSLLLVALSPPGCGFGVRVAGWRGSRRPVREPRRTVSRRFWRGCGQRGLGVRRRAGRCLPQRRVRGTAAGASAPGPG